MDRRDHPGEVARTNPPGAALRLGGRRRVRPRAGGEGNDGRDGVDRRREGGSERHRRGQGRLDDSGDRKRRPAGARAASPTALLYGLEGQGARALERRRRVPEPGGGGDGVAVVGYRLSVIAYRLSVTEHRTPNTVPL